MTKNQTRAILEGAGGTTEKSANLGNVGKISSCRFFGSDGGTRLSAETRALRLVAITCRYSSYGIRRFPLLLMVATR